MAVKIDKSEALRVLEEEAKNSETESCSEDWISRVNELWSACKNGNRTFMAMLGTALLAKATNLDADPFALKASSNTPGAYSARSLAQHVLAAHSIRLQIDLGVTGREPLNNQPFFAKEMVSEDLPIKDAAREAFAQLRSALGDIKEFRSEREAREALRAFIVARRITKANHQLGDVRQLTPAVLAAFIEEFVASNSESGNRAQAVAAGLLDVLAGHDRVRVGKIHDPDQRFPGDVGVTHADDEETLERSFEVRDKPVADTDLYHLVRKASAANLNRVGMFAVSTTQSPVEAGPVMEFAEEQGVLLEVYFGWREIVRTVLFWSVADAVEVSECCYRAIFQRLLALEVSSDGVSEWKALGNDNHSAL